MKEFGKAIVGIAAIALIGLEALDKGINGNLIQWCIISITAIVLGADAVTEWLEGRKTTQ